MSLLDFRISNVLKTVNYSTINESAIERSLNLTIAKSNEREIE